MPLDKQIISILGLPNRFAGLLLLLALGMVMSGASRFAHAGYADGAGGGQYQNQIYWLDWSGFNFINGNSKIFTLPGGVTVTATVSNITGGAVSIGRPEDYGPAAMNRAYPNTGRTAINSCTGCTNSFRLTFSASLGGTSIPVDLVAIDAEAASAVEYLKVTTDGNTWQLLEQFQAVNLRATWSNNDKTVELHGNGSTTYGTVLAVSTNLTNLDFELKGGGISAAALGVFLPFDYGDAPASFGDAGHYINQAFTGGLPGATKVYDPVSTAFTSFATVSDAPTVFVGAVKPDPDPGSLNTGTSAATALGDDTDKTDDEDGVASFPPLTIVTSSYSIQATVNNTSGNPATVYGWIDLNGNGSFEAAEAQTATVPSGGSGSSVTLTWPNPQVASGATIYARLRLTSSLLSDNSGTPADERAQGTVSDGEVEDYLIPVTPLGSLTVIKNAVGGDSSFSFNTTGLSPASFTLTTAGGTGQRTFPDLLPGNYSVTELLSPAWNLTSATCSDGSPVDNITLALSENVTCTFTNTQVASYSVSATVSGGNGAVSCTPASVTAGGNSSCTAVPNPGFQVQNWSGACAASGSNVQCTLSNIQADQTSTVTFVGIPLNTYSVSATVSGGNGTVSCSPASVTKGGSSSCTAVPNPGYQVGSWSGACAAWGSNVQCSLTKIQADQVSTVNFSALPPASYHVSASVVGSNGSVSCNPTTVTKGGNSTCTAVPDAGYQVQIWSGACVASGANSDCYLPKIRADQTSTVTFEPIPPATYNVSANVIGGNGHVSCSPTSVQAGGASTCTAVPDAGYLVQGWSGDCQAAGAAAQCDLTNIQTDQSSTVSFATLPVPTFTISATVNGGNGSVSCAPSPVPQGDSSSCTAVPNPGYQVQGWTGDCTATGTNAHCALSNLQADQTSTVSFAAIPPNTYHVSASVVLGHGSVSCTPSTVNAGGVSTCTAVPEAGYQVSNWGGDCAGWGSNVQCYLSKIKADKTATVSFAPLPPASYTVSATVSAGNGHVSCTPGTVTAGGGSTCIAVPDAGYAVLSWTGDCAASGGNAQCDLTNIQADQSSTVRFAAQSVPTYAISATVTGGNGAVSCSPSPVPQGDSSGCTAVPDPGYQIAAWTGACAATGHIAHCALNNVQSDLTSTVRFEVIPSNSYSVTATVDLGHGSVSCTPGTVTAGGGSTCIAVPEAGYQVHDWSGDCAPSGSQAQCHLTHIRANQVSAVSFTPLLPATYTISATVTGGNGTVGCNPSRVAKGGQSTCIAVPATSYQVQDWSGDCAAAGNNVQCYLPKIQKNQTSTVRFSALPPGDVHITARVVGGNGTVSCTPANAPVGGSSTCTATPDAGYQVAHWDGACLLSGQNAQCTLPNLQTDLTSTVTFESTRQDTLTVVKRTVGGDGPFPFVSRSLGDFSLTTVNGEAQRSFGNLAPGLYDLSEIVPADWVQISATCDNGDAPDNIRLAPGQTVKCTFVNRYTNTVVDIPTLSEWGLLILGVLLTLGARWYGPMRLARRR